MDQFAQFNSQNKEIVAGQYFTLLDGLRGVAAILVVLVHGYYTPKVVIHAGEAVDFFFVLSGLVMARAYEARLISGALTTSRFALIRIVRLYPMIVLGTILGAVEVLIRLILWRHLTVIPMSLLALFAGLLLIPIRPQVPDLAPASWMFPYCPQAWSIFQELLSNVAYVALIRHLTARRLVVVVAVAAIGLTAAIFRNGGGSFGIDWNQLGDATWRIFYGFPCGLLIYRIIKQRKGYWAGDGPALLLLAGFVAACCFPVRYASRLNPYVDTVLAVCVMPAVVLLGAQINPGPQLSRLCRFLGRLSYPLYLSHFALISIFWSLFAKLKLHGQSLWILLALQILAPIALGILVMKLFDEPVRAFLRRRLLERPAGASKLEIAPEQGPVGPAIERQYG